MTMVTQLSQVELQNIKPLLTKQTKGCAQSPIRAIVQALPAPALAARSNTKINLLSLSTLSLDSLSLDGTSQVKHLL